VAGHIDLCTTSLVTGWAATVGQPAELDVFDEGVARIRCGVRRSDLAENGLSTDAGRKFGICSTHPQDSPHLSDRSKNVGEERLLLQHLREALHQRTQPVITHGWQ
jgi:hypothetical protein